MTSTVVAPSSSATVVPPPDYSVWWDVEATTTALLAQLRLRDGDVDESRLRSLVDAAGEIISSYLDRLDPLAGPPPPPPVQAALEQVAVELYRRKDTQIGSASDYGTPVVVERYAAGDVLADVLAQLLPYRQRWGLA